MPSAVSGAIDLESKLVEGTLAFGQVCNFRQFAHGRHLQPSGLSEPVTMVSFSTGGDPLATKTTQLLPTEVGPVLDVALPRISDAGAGDCRRVGCDGNHAGMAERTHRSWRGQPDVPHPAVIFHALDVSTPRIACLTSESSHAEEQVSGDPPEVLFEHARSYIKRP